MNGDDGLRTGRCAASVAQGRVVEPDVLEHVALPVTEAALVLTSGRSVELCAAADEDRITVRGRDGKVVLRIGLTDAGAALELAGPELELRAPERLTLAAKDISIRAERDLELSVGGNVREVVAGSRHAEVHGPDRLEAAEVELQANERSVCVRAMEAVTLDAEHIGLNDDPCPRPFAWSSIARAEEAGARPRGADVLAVETPNVEGRDAEPAEAEAIEPMQAQEVRGHD